VTKSTFLVQFHYKIHPLSTVSLQIHRFSIVSFQNPPFEYGFITKSIFRTVSHTIHVFSTVSLQNWSFSVQFHHKIHPLNTVSLQNPSFHYTFATKSILSVQFHYEILLFSTISLQNWSFHYSLDKIRPLGTVSLHNPSFQYSFITQFTFSVQNEPFHNASGENFGIPPVIEFEKDSYKSIDFVKDLLLNSESEFSRIVIVDSRSSLEYKGISRFLMKLYWKHWFCIETVLKTMILDETVLKTMILYWNCTENNDFVLKQYWKQWFWMKLYWKQWFCDETVLKTLISYWNNTENNDYRWTLIWRCKYWSSHWKRWK